MTLFTIRFTIVNVSRKMSTHMQDSRLREAFEAGRDCAINKPSETNCDYRLFADREYALAWGRGVQEGERIVRQARGFVIVWAVGRRRPGIKCLVCGMTSYNRCDVDSRYCGGCHIFHDDADAVLQALKTPAANKREAGQHQDARNDTAGSDS
jgi:hypothetical protein